MTVKDCSLQQRCLSMAAHATEILALVSVGLLILALSGRFPLSWEYVFPFRLMTGGSKPSIWVGLFVLLMLGWIALRFEGGHVTRLFTHPTSIRIFLIALFIYNANGRWTGADDTIPARLLPYSLLKEANFDLDEFRFIYAHGVPGYLIQAGRHIVSTYPPGAALLALPFYLLPVLGGVAPELNVWGSLIDVEKLAAATLTAMSVALMYATLRRLIHRKAAFLLSVIYAFGTSAFSISSQALWQHGPSQLLLAASLYCLVRGMDQPKWVPFSGVTLGGAVLCRPTILLVAVPLATYVFHAHRKQSSLFTLFVLPPAAFFLLYNYWYFGSATRVGYDQGFFSVAVWNTPFFEGLAGILASPSRGLFVYSPVFLFSIGGAVIAWRSSGKLLYRYVSLAVVAVIALYGKWPIWWGGWSFGPRLLADLAPLLTLLMVPTYQRLATIPPMRGTLYALAAVSITVHVLGAFAPGVWSPGDDPRSRRLWSWADGELLYRGRLWVHTIAGTPRPRELPTLALSPDRTLYYRGEPIKLRVIVRGADAEGAELFLAIERPDGQFHFIGPSGLVPFAVPLFAPLPRIPLVERSVEIRLPDSWPPGRYVLQGALRRAGLPVASLWKREGLIGSSIHLFVTLVE